MLTHDKIWSAIDLLAKRHGYSASGLAKKAGLDSTSFNKSKRHSSDGKPRWPSTESLAKILSVTDTKMAEFISLVEPHTQELLNMNREEIAAKTAKILIDTQSVLFNARDPFTLKSGRKSPVYIDCRRLISFPQERRFLMDSAAKVLSDEIGVENMDIMAGGETAGIPYGAFVADRLEKPMIYVRKEPKGYGRMAQIEGHMDENQNVVLIEDLQTDGGSKKIFIDALRAAGATVEHAFVVFHYGIFESSEENMKDMGITLHALASWWDVLKAAKSSGHFETETLNAVEAFLQDPEGWQARASEVGT